MPRKSKIPSGPGVTEILHCGKRAWIHRYKARDQKHERGPGLWRAKIEGYRGDVVFGAVNLSKSTFKAKVCDFLEALAEREKKHDYASHWLATEVTSPSK